MTRKFSKKNWLMFVLYFWIQTKWEINITILSVALGPRSNLRVRDFQEDENVEVCYQVMIIKLVGYQEWWSSYQVSLY